MKGEIGSRVATHSVVQSVHLVIELTIPTKYRLTTVNIYVYGFKNIALHYVQFG